MGKKLVLLFFLTFVSISFGQNVTGVVLDQNLNPVESASVILLNTDNNIVAFAVTNASGNYTISTENTGNYDIQISSIGFKKHQQSIILTKKAMVLDVNLLTDDSQNLEEIIIEVEQPIQIKKDTVSYLVKAFTNGKEQVIEDLLKKLPGITVESDGTIKAGDQQIEKIMIDGDDFFSRGYQMVSKNMPVTPVEKVEVYSHYSNNKLLKGIENSDKVALNLVLDDKAKRQWFGNLDVGYGLVSENRYDVKGVLMNFGKKDKYFLVSNLNNTSYNATGDIGYNIQTYNLEEIGSLGTTINTQEKIVLNTNVPYLHANKSQFNNAEMGSANAIFTLNTQTKLKVQGFADSDNLSRFRTGYQTFNQADLNFTNTEDFFSRANKHNAFAKIELQSDINNNSNFNWTSLYNYTERNDLVSLQFNQTTSQQNLKTYKAFFDNKFNFTHKFNNLEVLVLQARQVHNSTPQQFTNAPFLLQDYLNVAASATNQKVQNKINFYGVSGNYLKRSASGNLLTLNTAVTFTNNIFNSQLQLIEPTQTADLSSFINQTQFKNTNANAGVGYMFVLGKFKLEPQIQVNYNHFKLQNIDSVNTNNPLYINTKLLSSIEISDKKKISFLYESKTQNTEIDQMHQNYLQTGYRTFIKGLQQVELLSRHVLSLGYKYGKLSDKFTSSSNISYHKSNQYLGYSNLIEPNLQASALKINNDQNIWTANTTLNYYLKPIKNNIKINVNYNHRSYAYDLNNQTNLQVTQATAAYGFDIKSMFKGPFNYHLNTTWQNSWYKTTNKTNAASQFSYLDLNLNFSEKLYFILKNELYYFNQLQQNKYYHFTDATLQYDYQPNKLTFTLSGRNLTNTKQFTTYFVNDISSSQTQYQLIPRYVLASIKYRF